MIRAILPLAFLASFVLAAGDARPEVPPASPEGIAAAARREVARPDGVKLARQTWVPPRTPASYRRSRPRASRAVLIGAVVGAAAGGAIVYAQYRESGAEAAWLGVYAGGFAGACVGWRVSR